MNINSLYGLLPRASLRKVLDSKISKSGIKIIWLHSLMARDGYTFKSIPYADLLEKIQVSRRNFFYQLDHLKEAEILHPLSRSRVGFKALSVDLRECTYIAEQMRTKLDYEFSSDPLGGMPYGTLPRQIFQKAIAKEYRRSTLIVYWFLSLNTYAGEHQNIEFDAIKKSLGISLSEMWRAISQLQEDGEYQVTKLHGGFKGFIPAIPAARSEAKQRRYNREIIDELLKKEEAECKAGLNRKLHPEERKTLRQFAEERIAEGINPITHKKLVY
ncbi:hypothetical protein F4009_13990 [Candidatus Poribacteria bacterium]|nr:hypothetical protein [Candidatus Poribacteria bacterium]MYH80619.1 hypothetical protein [Candidatus Poribacteria bacterium]MYK95085.1 hypothetical protein [Candidatus Poribacteria bacterium]